MVADILRDKMHLQRNPDFQGRRKGILNPALLSIEDRNKLILKQPAYGHIICRCEMISEGEILDAIHRPLGGAFTGRREAQDESRYGAVPGRILFAENDGDSGKGTGRIHGSDYKGRRKLRTVGGDE